MNAIEVAMKPVFKEYSKKSHPAGKEIAKLLYFAPANNNSQQEKETAGKIQEVKEKSVKQDQKGLPSQPQGYIRYTDYDLF